MMKKQQGFILITGLIFLAILSVVVLYLFRGALLEEIMTRNVVGRQRALQAAEAAMREGETKIQLGGPPFDPYIPSYFLNPCLNGLCRALPSSWKDIDWSKGVDAQVDLNANQLAKPPKYLIEIISEPSSNASGCPWYTYRVFAKAWSADGSESTVQSHYQFLPKQC